MYYERPLWVVSGHITLENLMHDRLHSDKKTYQK